MTRFLCCSLVLSALIVLIPPASADESNWTDRLAFKGDMRLRYEGIDEDGEPDRNRMRYRARIGLSGEVNDDVKIVVQLATGGDNPVSTNQTFDDGFSTKDIGLDLAYVEWKAAEGLKVFGGKMKNPMYRAGSVPLIWDGDLNPEGFAASYQSGHFFGNVAAFSVEERSSADDSLLYAAQAGMSFSVGGEGELTAGVGYFSYTDTIGNAPFYDGSAKGNSVDAAGLYLFEYANTELFAQYDVKVGTLPLRIYAHWTKNNEASREDTAYAFGAKLGSAKGQGSTEFSWTYQDIEADAVIGTFNDSDFGGGGTDSDGHLVKARYMLRDKIGLGGTLFINDVDRFGGTEHGYNRIQLDIEFKFN